MQIACRTVSWLICLCTSFAGFTIFEEARNLFTLLQQPKLNVVSWGIKKYCVGQLAWVRFFVLNIPEWWWLVDIIVYYLNIPANPWWWSRTRWKAFVTHAGRCCFPLLFFSTPGECKLNDPLINEGPKLQIEASSCFTRSCWKLWQHSLDSFKCTSLAIFSSWREEKSA